LPLFGKAREVMSELYCSCRPPGQVHVFPSPFGDWPIDFRYSWEKALAKAKVENFHFHDLRHSAASYLAMQGATSGQIAEMLGQKTLAMVKRYSHFNTANIDATVERMNRAMF
jgi:integrase